MSDPLNRPTDRPAGLGGPQNPETIPTFAESLKELAGEVVEEKAELKPFRKFYAKNKHRIKHHLPLIFVTGAIFGYIGFSLCMFLNEKSAKEFAQSIVSLSASVQANSVFNENLSREVQEKNHQIELLNQDKNKLEMETEAAKNATAELRLLAQNLDASNPLDNTVRQLISKMDRDLTAFDASTNIAALFAAERPKLVILVNNVVITNNSIVSLKASRNLSISVLNNSEIAADTLNLFFTYSKAIRPSDVLHDQSWAPLFAVNQFTNNQLTPVPVNGNSLARKGVGS